MVLPVALGSLAPYAVKTIEYAPYAIAAFQALYGLSSHLGEKYGAEMRQIKREYEERGFEAIRDHSKEILAAAGYALVRGVHSAYEVYRQVKASLKIRPSGNDPTKAVTIGSLMFLSILSLSYFTLVPQKTTIHAIVPMAINIPGLFLSFILLSVVAWFVLKKD